MLSTIYYLLKYINKLKIKINKKHINYDKICKYINIISQYKCNNIEYNDLIDIEKYNVNNLPYGVNIYTMCASCKLNVRLNIENIEKYLKINMNDILLKKINTNNQIFDKIEKNIDTILLLKKKKKRKNTFIINENINYNKCFYNQITIIVRITNGISNDLSKEPRINMKLFKNGSIQMSGCKSINNINIALNKIIYILHKSINTNYPFIDNMTNIDTIKIINFKMDMINSNYKINMQIDRPKLHQLLIKKKIRAIFEPCIKASVIIKIPIKDNYNLDMDNNIFKDNNDNNNDNNNNNNNKDISIFIFQKGNIIINSSKSKEHIIKCYEYINNILYTFKDDIIKIDDKIENDIIFKYYDKIMADVKCGLIQLNDIEHNILSSKLYSKKNKNI